MKLGSTRRVTEKHCLQCGTCVSAAASVDADVAPSPDDVTICIKCGHLMAFANDLSLRELTDSELHEWAGDERVLAAQNARGKLF